MAVGYKSEITGQTYYGVSLSQAKGFAKEDEDRHKNSKTQKEEVLTEEAEIKEFIEEIVEEPFNEVDIEVVGGDDEDEVKEEPVEEVKTKKKSKKNKNKE